MVNTLLIMSVDSSISQSHWINCLRSLTQSENVPDIFLFIDGPVNKEILLALNQFYLPTIYVERNSGPNVGLASAMNSLLKASRNSFKEYDFMFRMDADDLVGVERFKIQTNYLIEHPEVAVLGTATNIIDDQDNLISSRFVMPLPCPHHFASQNQMVHPTVAFSLKHFDGFEELYDIRYKKAQDYELWMRLITKGYKLKNINDPSLFYFRRSHATLSRRFGYENNIQILRAKLDFIKTVKLGPLQSLYVLIMFLPRLLPAKLVLSLAPIFLMVKTMRER